MFLIVGFPNSMVAIPCRVVLKVKKKGRGRKMLTVHPMQCSVLPDALPFGLSYMESDDPEAISGLPFPGNKDLRPMKEF